MQLCSSELVPSPLVSPDSQECHAHHHRHRPAGAGKTTVASQLARSAPLGVHLVGDQVFHWIVAGYVPPWMPGTSRQNGAVIAAIAAAAARFADEGYAVFVDAIIGPWFLPHWLRAAGAGELAQYVILRPSRHVAAARAMRRGSEDDLVDPGPVGAMFDAFEDLGTFESRVLDSSDQDAEATVEAVQTGLRAGRYLLTPGDNTDIARLSARFGVDPVELD